LQHGEIEKDAFPVFFFTNLLNHDS